MRLLISIAIFLLICVPAIVLSVPVVGGLLLTSWGGYTTIFGNAKWGRGNTHFSTPTKGWWQEFKWLVYRNPVNNLMARTLAIEWGAATRIVKGDEDIGDKTHGGFYRAYVLNFWEYYWIKPYGKRCLRVRIGWKILNSDTPAAFVFSINPIKPYLGA